MANKVALLILDGWGIGKKDKTDAIFNANTPFMDKLIQTVPNATLLTDGENVGLPEGQMGNSEVGHLNIGAGRIVYQDLVKVNVAIKTGELAKNDILLQAFEYAKTNQKQVHFIGLVSDGGVHSHLNHLAELCRIAASNGITQSYIHAFTDGRDTDPTSGRQFIGNLEQQIKGTGAQIKSIIGRYFAMDRDKRWERIKKAYDLLTAGIGEQYPTANDAILSAYERNITDEFIEPVIIGDAVCIAPNDVVICFNFRTDRCREITQVLTQQDFLDYGMKTLPLHYVTMTNYDKTYRNVNVIFDKDNLTNTLGETIAVAGKTQVRIAETEKYPHVTFFFSGGQEKEFPGERRLMVNSPKVATYDLQPEMSAHEIANCICDDMDQNKPDFICLNFANADMVGHTGNFSAIVKAVEATDTCCQKVTEKARALGYHVIIIADHGNADVAINADGSPNTAHSTNPVPLVYVGDLNVKLRNGILADVAPTVLDLLKITQPPAMTGKSLIA